MEKCALCWVGVSCDARWKNGKCAQPLSRNMWTAEFWRPRRWWEDNINVKEIGCRGFAGLKVKQMLIFPEVKSCSLRAEWLIWIWVRALTIPMHLGLSLRALCAPYQFEGALLLCWSSRWPPELYSSSPVDPKTETCSGVICIANFLIIHQLFRIC